MAKASAHLPTLDAVAKHAGVSTTSLATWRTQHDGFPTRAKRGYSRAAVDRWMKKHGLGSHREATTGRAGKLTAARQKWTEQKARTEEARADLAELERQKALGNIVLVDDVQRIYGQTVGLIVATAEGCHDAIDRTLPDAAPTSAEWATVRGNVLALIGRFQRDVHEAIKHLTEDSKND